MSILRGFTNDEKKLIIRSCFSKREILDMLVHNDECKGPEELKKPMGQLIIDHLDFLWMHWLTF